MVEACHVAKAGGFRHFEDSSNVASALARKSLHRRWDARAKAHATIKKTHVASRKSTRNVF